jgi:hypothetical protein
MAKLFSFEEQDLAQAGTDAALDSSPEEGAVAETAQSMMEDHAEIQDIADGVQEGTDAASQLEQVQAAVQESQEAGGLDQVAAEGYRLAVEAIASRVGYPSKSVYALYSTENFRSSSSRAANTRIALEGIGEFLANLWERIKAAVNAVIEKVKAFYKKHISGLGRVTKALESVKKKISETKGSFSKVQVKVPASFLKAFPTNGTFTVSTIEAYIDRQSADTVAISKNKLSKVTDAVNLIDENFTFDGTHVPPEHYKEIFDALAEAVTTSSTNEKPYVGGKWVKVVSEARGSEHVLEVTTETTDISADSDSELHVATKSELTTLVSKTTKLITETKAIEKAIDTFSKNFQTASKKISAQLLNAEKALDDLKDEAARTAKKEGLKEEGNLLKEIGKVSTISTTLSTALTSYNVKAAFAVVSFVKFNLAQYK